MTKEQKETIKKMRLEGNSYSQIATELNILEGTIKAFCSRNKIYMPKTDITQKHYEKGEFCKYCGKPIIQNKNTKLKLFCNDKCRLNWWNKNQDKVNKKAIYKIICKQCGIEFESYGNKSRIYCSHSCYIKFKKGGNDDVKRAV